MRGRTNVLLLLLAALSLCCVQAAAASRKKPDKRKRKAEAEVMIDESLPVPDPVVFPLEPQAPLTPDLLELPAEVRITHVFEGGTYGKEQSEEGYGLQIGSGSQGASSVRLSISIKTMRRSPRSSWEARNEHPARYAHRHLGAE